MKWKKSIEFESNIERRKGEISLKHKENHSNIFFFFCAAEGKILCIELCLFCAGSLLLLYNVLPLKPDPDLRRVIFPGGLCAQRARHPFPEELAAVCIACALPL